MRKARMSVPCLEPVHQPDGETPLVRDPRLHPARVMSDDLSSPPDDSIGMALESDLRLRAMFVSQVKC